MSAGTTRGASGRCIYPARIKTAALVLFCDLLRGERMHAHDHAMNLIELRAVFFEIGLRRQRFNFFLDVVDTIAGIRMVAEELRSLATFLFNLFEEPGKLRWIVACVIHDVGAE